MQNPSAVSSGIDIYGQLWGYQTFIPARPHYFNYVSLVLYKVGAPTFITTISLYNTAAHEPTGTPLCSTTFVASSLTATATWRTYKFATGWDVSAGTEYALVLSGSGGTSASKVTVGVNVTGSYSGGTCGYSTTGGTGWQALPGEDMAFKEGQDSWDQQFMGHTTGASVYDQTWISQTFTPSISHDLNDVSLCLYRAGAPTATVTIGLYNVDTNHQPLTELSSTTFAASSLTTTATWREFRFTTGYQVSAELSMLW